MLIPAGALLDRAALASLREIERVAAWLLPRLPAFEQSHPRVEVSLLVDQKLNDPATGEIDLAIRMGTGQWSDVCCEPLMR